ncbi:MAG: arginine deiminase family protein, partial [Thermoanaerobaculia bacterium]|nr:arginine deiminase family protein [Thermoanaerobaculia bacterium]
RGVEVLADLLRSQGTSFRHLVAVEIPERRAFMHLDTVFTIVDREACLAYPPVIQGDGPEAASVYSVDLGSEDLTFTLRPGLLQVLAELGVELESIPCGGPDLIDQEREQWTDGANAFAVAPGLVLFYERNRKTAEELRGRGWRVLTDAEVLDDPDPGLDGPTAITISGRELSRARGGARCMAMPLERASLTSESSTEGANE